MEFITKSTRVLPTYRDLISDYLGMAQIILGFLTLVLSIAGFIIRSYTSATTMGVITAICLNITGILGVISGLKKELWAISLYFGLSAITVAFSLVMFMASIISIGYESARESLASVTARESLDICLAVLGLLCGSTAVCSILLSGATLFTDSCKCAKGALYIEEPNVQYSQNEVNTSGTSVNASSTNPEESQVGNDTNSVKETRQGDIRSFENPATAQAEYLHQSQDGSFPM